MPVVALALVTAVASLGACAPGSGLRVPECTPAVWAYLWSPRIMLTSVCKVLVDVDNQNCEPQIDIGNGRKAAVTGSENARGTCMDHLVQLHRLSWPAHNAGREHSLQIDGLPLRWPAKRENSSCCHIHGPPSCVTSPSELPPTAEPRETGMCAIVAHYNATDIAPRCSVSARLRVISV